MRKQALVVAGVLVLSVVVAAGHAYALETIMKAEIPFEFAVGNQMLPAGEYDVLNLSSGSGGLLLRRSDGSASAMVFTIPTQANDWQEVSKLVFNRYGDHYFLSQIWTAGEKVGQKLNPSRQEREVARKQVREEIALLVR